MSQRLGLSCCLIVLAIHLPLCDAGDWPQWRGPNRDGIVHGVKVPERWPKSLKEEWKVAIGEGVSSPIVISDRVFVFARQKDEEVVVCLDLGTGKELWKTEPYQAPYQWWLGEGEFSKGPRSTPTYSEGRIYTSGVSGDLSCWNASSGKLVWRKRSTQRPPYGGPASPLVVDGLCIVHLGNGGRDDPDGLAAYDAASGEIKWRFADASSPGMGSPIVVEWGGERQVVGLTSWDLRGVSLNSGKKLWSVKVDGAEKDITPVLYRDLIIYADYKDRPRAIRLEKSDKGIVAKEVWQGDGPTPYMSTPVILGDLMYGMSVRKSGSFFCLDARTGKTVWESEQQHVFGYASVVGVGDAVLYLTPRGHLVIVKTGQTQFEPIAEYTVSDRQTWAHPVFLGDRILIRDDRSLRSLRIEASAD